MSQNSTSTWLPLRSACEQCVVEMVEEEPPVDEARQRVLKGVAGELPSNALRSEVSRNTITAPGGDEGPTTGEAVIVTGKCARPTDRTGCRSWSRCGATPWPARPARAGSPAPRRAAPGRRRRQGRVYQPSMLGPAGFKKVMSPVSLMAQTPSPRLLVYHRRCRLLLLILLLPLALWSPGGLAGGLRVGRGTGADRTRRLMRRPRGRAGCDGRPGCPRAAGSTWRCAAQSPSFPSPRSSSARKVTLPKSDFNDFLTGQRPIRPHRPLLAAP